MRILRIASVWLVLPLFVLFSWLVWVAMLFSGLRSEEGLDIAQTARNLSQGLGFVTSVIRPLSLRLMPHVTNHPDYLNAPFMPLLDALLFRLGGAEDRMVLLASGSGWLLCAATVWWLAKELFARRRTAWLAVVFWTLNTMALHLSLSGRPHLWATGWFTLILCLLARARHEAAAIADDEETVGNREEGYHLLPLITAGISGLFTALLGFCLPATVWLISPVMLVFWARWDAEARLPKWNPDVLRRATWWRHLLFQSYSSRLVGMYLLFWLPFALAWYGPLIKETWPYGTGLRSFFMLLQTADYPGWSVFRGAAKTPMIPWCYPVLRPIEALTGSLRITAQLPALWMNQANPVILFLFVLALFTERRSEVRRFAFRLLFMALGATVLFSLIAEDAASFMIFAPSITVLAAGWLSSAAEWIAERPYQKARPTSILGEADLRHWRMIMRKAGAYVLVIVLAALPRINERLLAPQKISDQIPQGLEYIIAHSTTSEIIMTDSPWITAWYGHRTALWLPQTLDDFDWISKQTVEPDWILLTGVPQMAARELPIWWVALANQQTIAWRNYERIPGIHPYQRVFRRKDR